MSVATIQDEALNLSPADRARLIDALWNSLSDQDLNAREAAWAAESERRIDAVESGALKARDADAVFLDLKKGLNK
ncbi:MAG: addiction module protein [Verrucomicrobiota bacterium]|jgi:putative addiction module component (TIGR02574 family)